MSHPERIGNERISLLQRRKRAEDTFATVAFAIGCVGWMVGIFLLTCRIVWTSSPYGLPSNAPVEAQVTRCKRRWRELWIATN